MKKKTYGEFCGLARSLDHVGDRWTLLIVRELLVGALRYRELQDGLPGVATNLLAQRLRQLEHDGIVRRRLDDDSGVVVYELTTLGAGLQETVLALVRWGTAWMGAGPGSDNFRPRWLVIALRALLPDGPVSPESRAEVWCGADAVSVKRSANGLHVSMGPIDRPHAKLTGDPALVLAVAARLTALGDARRTGADIEGSVVALHRALFARAPA